MLVPRLAVCVGFLNLARCAVSADFACRVCLPAPTFVNPEVFLLPVNLVLEAVLVVSNFLVDAVEPLLSLVEKDFVGAAGAGFGLYEENILLELLEDEDERKVEREGLEKLRLLLKPLASASVTIIGKNEPITSAAIANVSVNFLNMLCISY